MGLTRTSSQITFAETWCTGLDQNTRRSKFCPNGIEAKRFRKCVFFTRKSPNPRLQSDCDLAALMEAEARPWLHRERNHRKERNFETWGSCPDAQVGQGCVLSESRTHLTSRTVKEKGTVRPFPSQALHSCSSLTLLPFRASLPTRPLGSPKTNPFACHGNLTPPPACT